MKLCVWYRCVIGNSNAAVKRMRKDKPVQVRSYWHLYGAIQPQEHCGNLAVLPGKPVPYRFACWMN